jgi:D-alanyl-D-alanine carboxypeptidase
MNGNERFPRVCLALRNASGLVGNESVSGDISPDALFPIYSVTKTLTAVCVFRLVEQGVLALDAPVRRLVPDVPLPDSITVAHLLFHTSGVADYGDLPRYHSDVRAHPARPWTRADFLDATLSRGLLFNAGHGWAYSNVGYMLLVDVIERVIDFAGAIARFVAEPLGLANTRVLSRLEDLEACEPGFGDEVSQRHDIVDVRGVYHPGWCAPRLAASTGRELTTIFEALTTGRLLSPSSMRRMLELVPLPEPDGTPSAIWAGAGLFHDRSSPLGANLHHAGAGPGYDISATAFLDVAGGPVTAAAFVNTSTRPGAAANAELHAVEALCSSGL